MSRPTRRPPSFWQRPSVKRGLTAACIALTIASAVSWFVLSGTAQSVTAAVDRRVTAIGVAAGLKVESLTLSGRRHASREDILSAAAIEADTPIWTVSPARLRKRIEALPWIADAEVTRKLPDSIHIAITERSPAALWQHQQRLRLIDHEGAILGEADLGRFAHLPIVVGAQRYALPISETTADRFCPARIDDETAACLRAPDFREVLALVRDIPTVNARLHAVQHVRARRWDLHLTDGTVIKLPEGGAASALARLASIERSDGLLDRAVAMVDLRLEDRLIVKPLPGARPEPIIEQIQEQEI